MSMLICPINFDERQQILQTALDELFDTSEGSALADSFEDLKEWTLSMWAPSKSTNPNLISHKSEFQDLFTEILKRDDLMTPMRRANITRVLSNLNDIIKALPQQIITDSRAEFNFDATDQLVPILHSDLNKIIEQRLNNFIFGVAWYNEKFGLVSAQDIAFNIIDLKQELFDTICEYIGQSHMRLYLDPEGFSIQYGTDSIPGYQSIMKKTWQKLQQELLRNNSVYNAPINDPRTDYLLNVVQAFYILNNFDEFVENNANGIIHVLPSAKGTMETSVDKYQRINQQKVVGDFLGDHNTNDAAKNFSKIFRNFWGTIPNGRGGFLSTSDLTTLQEYMDLLINSKDTQSEWSKIIKSASTRQEQVSAIINALRNNSKLHRQMGAVNGSIICNNIADAFETFNQHYIDYWQDADADEFNEDLTLKDCSVVENKMDFIGQFISSITDSHNRTSVSYTGENAIKVESDARITVSKESITEKLKNNLITNLSEGNYAYIYNPNRITNIIGAGEFNEEFTQYINEILGINLSKQQLQRFFNNIENQTKLFDFIENYLYLIQTDLLPSIRLAEGGFTTSNITTKVNQFIDNLKKYNGRYIAFSDIYVQQNRLQTNKILDQAGNPQPVRINSNTIQQVAKNMRDFESMYSKAAKVGTDPKKKSKNILVAYSTLTSPEQHHNSYSSKEYLEHIAYRQDFQYKAGDTMRTVKAYDMNEDEILYLAFNSDFYDMMITRGMFANQVECYSDKVTIALAILKANAKFGDDKLSLRQRSGENIRNLWVEQQKDYYKTVAELIQYNLKTVLSTIPSVTLSENPTLLELIAKLETIKCNDFEHAISVYNAANPTKQVQLTKEIDYCGKGKALCRFNNTLLFNILAAYSPKAESQFVQYFDDAFEVFKTNMQDIEIPDRFRKKDYITENFDAICEMFGLSNAEIDKQDSLKKIQDFFKLDSNFTLVDGDKVHWVQDNELSRNLLYKYHALQQLDTDAELQITSKNNLIHDGKLKSGQWALSQLLQLDESGNIPTIENAAYTTEGELNGYQHMVEDQSARLVVGKKRNNALVASYFPMSTNRKYGVADQAKVAVVYSKKQTIQNYNGQEDDGQDVIDGSLYTLGIAAFWENMSYPGKHIELVKKVIGLVPTFTSNQQFKCADYPIDNLLLRSVHDGIQSEEVNMWARARKMMEPGTLSNFFFTNKDNATKSLGIDINIQRGGKYYSLIDMSVVDVKQHLMTFTWKDYNGSDTFTETLTINNLWDLWNALGSAYTEERVDGNWVPSNASMEACALLVSEYDPSCKKRVVSKLIDVSSNKSGITNINLIEDVDHVNVDEEGIPDPAYKSNQTLNTFFIDNARWGEQQDYSHESDEAEIPSLTQVLSALSFNGKNIELVDDVYSSLAQLTLLKAKQLGIRFTPGSIDSEKKEFAYHKRMVESLLSSLQGSAVRSDAISLVRKVRDAMAEFSSQNTPNIYKELSMNVPYSSGDIFYKLASDLISKLNKKSIRQTYNGVAIVQNPSHSIIGIYNDKTGKTYTKNDLMLLGQKLAGNAELTPKEQIQYALDNLEQFSDDVITLDQIEMEDRISIINPETNETILPSQRITSAKQLFSIVAQLQDVPTYTIIRSYKNTRDLKGPSLHYYQNEKYVDEAGVEHIRRVYKNFWLSECVRLRSEAEEGNDSVQKARTLLYYRACLEGLGNKEGKPYLYATMQDWFDAITTNDPAIKESKKTYVENVTFEPGEQILPKVNRTAQGLSSFTLHQIEDLGAEYYLPQAKNKFMMQGKYNFGYLLERNLVNDDAATEGYLTVVRDKEEIVYTTEDAVRKMARNSFEQIQELTLDRRHITVQDGITWFLNDNYEPLFPIQSDKQSIFKIKTNDKDIYVVVFDSLNANKLQREEDPLTQEEIQQQITDNLNKYSSFVQQAVANIENINAVYEPEHREQFFTDIIRKYNSFINPFEDIDKQLQNYANDLYKSVLLSNYTISARIPSQSFQSFMPNKTVAFMDSGQNNGYVNLYEVWFTGSKNK